MAHDRVVRDRFGWLSDLPGASWVGQRSGLVVRVLSVLFGLLLWQWYALGQPAYLFPELQAIALAAVEQYQRFGLVDAYVSSMATMFAGYLIAAAVGVATGLAMGLDRRLDVMLNPYINAVYVAPVSAMLPIFILIGGPTFEVRVFVVFLFAFFEITIDTYEGVKTTPDGLLEASRSFGAGRWFTVRHVVLPHDLPYITAGLRLGLGRAVQGMILAEILIEFVNLGGIIREWGELFRIAGVLSVVLILMLTSIVLTRALQFLEGRLIAWESEVEI